MKKDYQEIEVNGVFYSGICKIREIRSKAPTPHEIHFSNHEGYELELITVGRHNDDTNTLVHLSEWTRELEEAICFEIEKELI